MQQTARKLAMAWGVQSFMTSDPADLTDMVRRACRIAFEAGYVKPGGGILITCGVPLGSPGATNMIRIAYVDENGAPVAENA